ncbi:MAG: primase [Clostridia bacterium]|nr:primase [Clostridia bacterium]
MVYIVTAFTQDVVDEVKERVDIVGFISSYVQLKKRGQNYVGLCPFHNEKTPSFTVSPEKNMFYCFGCGIGGDVITFIMKLRGINFPEALSTLAASVGVELVEKKETPQLKKQREFRERLYQLGALAANFYYRILTRHPAGARAREYLKKRGLKGEIVRQFQLGYAPNTGTAIVSFLRRQGFTNVEIEKSGICVLRSSRMVDRFRDRVMFPIKDSSGRVIGFGGRILTQGQPKYLNSPETTLFHKGKHLYGLHLALSGIRKRNQAIIVEGYMDMITTWQHGIDNVVASLGTSLTIDQARQLRKLTTEVIIAYDADTAGTTATLRGMEILKSAGLNVKVIQFPEGKDPDEYLNLRGTEAFQQLIENSKGLIEFCIDKAVNENDITTPSGQKAVIEYVLPYLKNVNDLVEQEAYVRYLSRRTGISETAIFNEINRLSNSEDKEDKTRYTRDSRIFNKVFNNKSSYNQSELFLLQAYLNNHILADRIDKELGVNWGLNPATNSLISEIKEKRESIPELAGSSLIRELSNQAEPERKALIAKLSLTQGLGPIEEKAVNKAIRFLKLLQLNKKEKELRLKLSQLETSGTIQQVKEIQKQIFDLQQKINLLKLGRGESQ